MLVYDVSAPDSFNFITFIRWGSETRFWIINVWLQRTDCHVSRSDWSTHGCDGKQSWSGKTWLQRQISTRTDEQGRKYVCPTNLNNRKSSTRWIIIITFINTCLAVLTFLLLHNILFSRSENPGSYDISKWVLSTTGTSPTLSKSCPWRYCPWETEPGTAPTVTNSQDVVSAA